MNQYPVGEYLIFDIGLAQIEHRIDALDSLHYRVLTGPTAGDEDQVPLDVQLVRPHVFLVSWQERDGTTVVHLEDFEQQRFVSCLTQPGAPLRRFSGQMRRATSAVG